ncbi:unnamed protein product [Cyprideis torosa]|uniref:Uncharacterized protein n=1 Tax=Cyprideis torosa TaxID=163714 RepID=A0A7R8ZQ01_9CRUS|nr:unnamed protein product [Cyprideis torosa]CAG0889479.1 unnamed protein product [Cyprideis torosa]
MFKPLRSIRAWSSWRYIRQNEEVISSPETSVDPPFPAGPPSQGNEGFEKLKSPSIMANERVEELSEEVGEGDDEDVEDAEDDHEDVDAAEAGDDSEAQATDEDMEEDDVNEAIHDEAASDEEESAEEEDEGALPTDTDEKEDEVCFGLPGLLCGLGPGFLTDNSKRELPDVHVYGPEGLAAFLRASLKLSQSILSVRLFVHELILPPRAYAVGLCPPSEFPLIETTDLVTHEELNHPHPQEAGEVERISPTQSSDGKWTWTL